MKYIYCYYVSGTYRFYMDLTQAYFDIMERKHIESPDDKTFLISLDDFLKLSQDTLRDTYNIYSVSRYNNYPEHPQLVEFTKIEPIISNDKKTVEINYYYREYTQSELDKNYDWETKSRIDYFKMILNPLNNKRYQVIFDQDTKFVFTLNSQTLASLASAIKMTDDDSTYTIEWKEDNDWIILDREKLLFAYSVITDFVQRNYIKLHKLLDLVNKSTYASIYDISIDSVEL